MRRVRAFFLPRVEASFPTVARFQRLCGVVNGKPTNAFLHALFTLGAALGNEILFILFLPYLFWEYDVVVARRLVILWGINYYIGQGLKDVLRLPRPKAPAVHLETHYQAEYGMPSTHAMNSCAMPWFIVLESWDRLADPQRTLPLLVALALFWSVTCCTSRIYMGVHSTWDVGVGALLGFALTLSLYSVIHPLDVALMTNAATPYALLALAVLLVALYPKPQKWVNSPGDVAIILGVCAGVGLGALSTHDPASVNTTQPIIVPSLWRVAVSLPWLALGFGVLFLTRALVKPVGVTLMTALFPSPPGCSTPPGQRYVVELPTKLLTYSCVGWNAVVTVPWLFAVLPAYVPLTR